MGPAILLGLATTLVGYLVSALVPFPVFEQIAVFCMTGLIVGSGCVLCLYPVLAQATGKLPDLGPRLGAALDAFLQELPLVDPDGTTTVGNAPGLNDGAAAVVVASEDYALENGLEPLARIVGSSQVADDFAFLARAPGLAGQRVLDRAGKRIGEVERIEINEAFASVALHSTRMLGADPERVNVNGGAVALGHPIGASGARLVTTLTYELRRSGGVLGLAAICSGGGQGDAILIEAA